ncbi:hypothetical protein EV183_002943 [Coemansia sp. RSA 2336]|nr:hypothetical protein EV183_002943 [Coemansia sp. RSA 2336]
MSSTNDHQMDISLLSILQSVDSDRLAEFLKNEHHELLALRSRVCTYEGVISELKLHLHNVFAVAGGLDALPLSESTRAALGLAKDSSNSVASQEGLSTPRSLHVSKGRTFTQPAEATAYAAAQQFLLHYPPLPQTPNPATTSETHGHLDVTERAPLLTTAEHSSEDNGQLTALLGELKQTVSEQQTDIEDLEAALRERKALIRALRKQMRDNELRQFAAASEHAGLRRTASIGATACPQDAVRAGEATADVQEGTGGQASGVQESKSPQDSESSLGSIGEVRRPSGYINGWPVYETKLTQKPSLKVVNAHVDAEERPEPNAQRLFAKEPLRYKASSGSGLSQDVASTQSSRAPRIFHSVVVKTPRRIYSRLSNRLKKD